jgi:signal transduction histidine kinase
VSRRIRWSIIVGCVAAAGVFLGGLRYRQPRLEHRVYTIGWMISPPFQVRGANGQAAGLSVDLVSEAARRRGIALKWIFWPESSESALKAKAVDLWPLITITPERLKSFHITEPYLQHDHCLLVRDDSPYRKIEDLSTATIAIVNAAIDIPHLHGVLPGAKPLVHSAIADMLADTCRGASNAAFMDKYTAISALLEMHDCGGHTLRWVGVSQVRSRLGVGSIFEAQAAAEALREEIGAMAREGRMAAIFGQWGFMSGGDLESVEALLDARRRETLLIIATVLFAALFALACWETVRLIRESKRIRLAEAEVRASRERAMQAQNLESIGRLAGGVAHDFNNLLTVINGYCEVVLGKLEQSDPLRAPVNEIRKAGQRAASLTQQLLAFGRKQVSRPQPVNLNFLVQDSEKMFRRLLGEDVELSVDLSSDLGLIFADPTQLHQVLMNLVVNARDAMPHGGTLRIATDPAEVDAQLAAGHPEIPLGPAVRLVVSDTGCGMDEHTREHIFEPFFTTKGLAQGTGLGLATVYGIVKQSHGWISVRSEPGMGSTFEIYLPRIDGAEAPDPAQPPGGPRPGWETILVVEDQKEVRAFAVSALTTHGYRVLDAADGAAALALAERHNGPIHLLLTDVVLPGINGLELADRIRTSWPKTAVLYTSGYTADVIVQRGVLQSDVSYIPKPYTAAEIAAKVRELLEAKV